MRELLFPLIVSLCCTISLVADQKDQPITPKEAAAKIDETVTLQMEVKSATMRQGLCFLNSETDFKDDKNFTIFIGKDALTKFKEAKVEDPAAHFKGKIITVKGKVTLYREKPQIAITDPEQIKILEKKEGSKPSTK